MRVLIVDDERPARDKLRRMLVNESGIEAIEEAANGVEALRKAGEAQFDLMFLDVQMPEMNGIDVAGAIPKGGPLVVFVTAYDAYAIQAFDANAIDYLLKPFDQARLQRALQRVRERLAPAAKPEAVRQLLVSERGVTKVVKVEDIDWIETADNYVALHTRSGSPLLRQTLAGLLDKLDGFIRCHRRAAVKTAAIASIVSLDKGDCELVLASGARVPCSRQYREAVIAAMA
jgi:two-component system, LytTR family, response regulator